MIQTKAQGHMFWIIAAAVLVIIFLIFVLTGIFPKFGIINEYNNCPFVTAVCVEQGKCTTNVLNEFKCAPKGDILYVCCQKKSDVFQCPYRDGITANTRRCDCNGNDYDYDNEDCDGIIKKYCYDSDSGFKCSATKK